LDTDTDNVVRGSATRALRQGGSVVGIGIGLIMLLMWLFAKNSSFGTKIVVSLAMIAFACVATLLLCVASSFTIAEVRNQTLNFYFFGMRTRSIPLEGSTSFELRKMGRMKVLCIQSRGSTYVPNGALDQLNVVELLRANGVAELKAV
jgi:hypothetical protein